MNVPMIYGCITSASAVRLFNAVISTGDEARRAATFTPRHDIRRFVERLETLLANGSVADWRVTVSAAREVVRNFMRGSLVKTQ